MASEICKRLIGIELGDEPNDGTTSNFVTTISSLVCRIEQKIEENASRD